MIEPQKFGLLTTPFCRLVSTAFYLSTGTFWWTKVLLRKIFFLFFNILHFRTLSENIWPFDEIFSFGYQNCNLATWNILWKKTFSRKRSFLFLSVLSASEIEQNFLAFLRKSWPACQNCIQCTQRIVFLRENNFLEKPVFYQFGTCDRKIMAFCQFFNCGCVKFSFYLSIGPFWWFFQKTYIFSYDILTVDRKKLQPFVMKNLAGVLKLHFHASKGKFDG